jgi:hypothetical protein
MRVGSWDCFTGFSVLMFTLLLECPAGYHSTLLSLRLSCALFLFHYFGSLSCHSGGIEGKRKKVGGRSHKM